MMIDRVPPSALSNLRAAVRLAGPATYTARHSNYKDVLYACVLSHPDGDGYFSPASIREPYSMIVGKPRGSTHTTRSSKPFRKGVATSCIGRVPSGNGGTGSAIH